VQIESNPREKYAVANVELPVGQSTGSELELGDPANPVIKAPLIPVSKSFSCLALYGLLRI
jgi:hypothetical protein